jgi:uncharacterized protein with HEPN domain
MPLEKVDVAYLWDMWDAAQAIREFISGKTFHHYQRDRMLRGAVERHLEIIGEAANRVPLTFRQVIRKYPGAALSPNAT